MNNKDVLIIGAGAAGAAAAFHLAKAGHKVTILEQKEQGLIKPCGGGMASSVQEWFPFDLKPAVEEIIKKVEFNWCLSDPVIAELPGTSPFWIVRREILDELLISKALEEGAELLRPFRVETLQKSDSHWQVSNCEGIQLEATAVVIADGSNSPWPQIFHLGPRSQHHAHTTSVRLKGRGNLKEGTARFEFGLVNHGFAWAFPLKDEVNIGIGTFLGNQAADSKKILNQFLPNLGFDPNEVNHHDSLLRVWNGHHSLHGQGILVVGDAASLCDPFLAEGLRPALMSGCEAAQCLNSWFKEDIENLSSYTKIMKKRWGESMAWGRNISQVFYRFPKVGYQLGIKRPTAPQRIAQILSGQMSYRDIAQRVIKRLLFANR